MSRCVADRYAIVVIMFDIKFSIVVSSDTGFWLLCFFFRSKYRIIVDDYFDSQRYLFLSQRFCQSVRSRTVAPGVIQGSLRLRFRLTVCFSVGALWIDGTVSEGKVVFHLRPNNFSAGKVPFWSGCEFRDGISINHLQN